jgi:alcohol dehydrogenase class IV
MTAIWSFPTRIVFGIGEAARAGDEVRAQAVTRALIVTDPGVEAAGLCERVRESLHGAGIPTATYTGIQSNPTESDITGGAAAFREHRADGLVAIGGGSPLDSAKLIGLRARTDLTWEELDDAKGGGRHVPRDVPPVIALPTTAGTGSEVGRAAVLTVESTKRKTVVFSPFLLPKVAILDPELTRSMPPKITAATGFDALTHSVEAYLALGDHPMADAIALAGIDLVVANRRTRRK